jgi:prolipoprotein diacylglyceryl transferase
MQANLLAIITLDLDPNLELGPFALAWHGVGIAVGIVVGSAAAVRYARGRGLDEDALVGAVLVLTLAGIAGARLFYLLENDFGALLRPGDWLGTTGFAFYGAMILGVPAALLYLRRRGMGLRYLDAMAFGFPLGMAVGRIGDLVNGEHYGPPSDLPWAIRYTHPEADVQSTAVAYHPGGLYEIVLALVMLALVWPLRDRFRRPGMLLWTVVALYGAGRFLMFFYRSDSDELALGLNGAQWTSVALVLVAACGAWWSSSERDFTRLAATTRSALRRSALLHAFLVIVAAGSIVLAAGCGGDEPAGGGQSGSADRPVVEDPGPVHVHGLGINPKDGALFIATHTGLFRAAKGETEAKRVRDRYQDTMGFTVVGPDRFLGSGHPDGRENLPPFLGLIESTDAGRTWRPIALQGEADFHVLEAAGEHVYGFGSDFETRREQLLVSRDGGRHWAERTPPEALIGLAIDPSDPRRVVASGGGGLHISSDEGRRWEPLSDRSGLLAWPASDRLYLFEPDGAVLRSRDGGRRWQATGDVGGQPAAFSSHGRDLYAALHDGTIKRSSDGGVSWTVRSTP